MEMTNMQADMILGQLNIIYASLTKNSEPAPCVLTVGLAKNIRKMQGELKEYFEEKQKLFLAEFTPLSVEDSGVELHKIRMTFDELCDVLENYEGSLSGDIMTLQLICKDEDQKEGE